MMADSVLSGSVQSTVRLYGVVAGIENDSLPPGITGTEATGPVRSLAASACECDG